MSPILKDRCKQVRFWCEWLGRFLKKGGGQTEKKGLNALKHLAPFGKKRYLTACLATSAINTTNVTTLPQNVQFQNRFAGYGFYK